MQILWLNASHMKCVQYRVLDTDTHSYKLYNKNINILLLLLFLLGKLQLTPKTAT